MKKFIQFLFLAICIGCQAQNVEDDITYEYCDTTVVTTTEYEHISVVCTKITLFGDTVETETTIPNPGLNPVDTSDLLLFVQAGQSVMNGHPTNSPNIGTVPDVYDSIFTNGTEYFLQNATWRNYTMSPSAFGPDVSFMHKMDSVYPGQIKLIKYSPNATRLRIDTRSNKLDWNVNSPSNEQWGRFKQYHLGDTNSIMGIKQLINNNPDKNIRLLAFQWGQGESDSNINTDAGDSLTLDVESARITYEADLTALYQAFLNHVSFLGVDTSECVLQIMELGPGSGVVNRDLYPGIHQAQINLVEQFNGILTETEGIGTYDGTHYSIDGSIEAGKRLAEDVLIRFN